MGMSGMGVMGLALLAFVFYRERPTPWIVSIAVLTLGLIMIFYRLGEGSFYDWDEAWYAQISKEMLVSNDWVVLHYNGFPFLHKPPLYFWLTAMTYKLVGVTEFAARFWSAVFGFGVMFLTFFLGLRLRSWAVGAAAVVLLLLVSPHETFPYQPYVDNFVNLSRVGMLETSLTFWIMTALLLVWESDRRPWLIALIGLPVGFAVMTKAWSGFFAILIPLVYAFFAKQRMSARVGYWMLALLLASLVVLPWHLRQLWTHGSHFVYDYVVANLYSRVTAVVEQEQHGALFYLDILHRGWSIWGYVLPPVYIWALWKAFKDRDSRIYLLLSWITIPLLLFSLSQTKIGWYISVIYPGVALLIALAVAEIAGDRIAIAGIAAIMAICCIHLPEVADGSPGVKIAAAKFRPYLDHHQPVFFFEKNCENFNLYPTWLFYLNVQLGCIDQHDITEGVSSQFIIDRELWPPLNNVSSVMVEAGKYLLARPNESLSRGSHLREPIPYVPSIRNAQ